LSQTEEPEAARLRELIAQADDEAWSEVVRWLHRGDAVEYSRARALEFAAAARTHLQELRDSSAKRILLEITEFATHRTY
jgi:octaprenyl-diphosphate synthase